MKRILAGALAFLLLITMLVPTVAMAAADYSYIKVKLDSIGSPTSITFKVAGAYRIAENSSVDLFPGITYTMTVDGTGQKISYNSGAGTVSTALPAKVTLVRYDNGTTMNYLYLNNPKLGWKYYPGDMTFLHESGTSYLKLVNTVYIESYLCSVVANEMGDDWPAEALKAQAICSRTYAMRFMKANEGETYDILDTSANQVYKGCPFKTGTTVAQNVVNAVNATKGMTIVCGTPSLLGFADGVFSTSNGGQVRTATMRWSTATNTYHVFKEDPYDLKNPSSPSFRFVFPTATDSTTMGLLSTDDKAKAQAMLDLIKTKLPAAILAQKGITCAAGDIKINGITAAAPSSQRPGVPSGSREYTKVTTTVNVTVSNIVSPTGSPTATPTASATASASSTATNSPFSPAAGTQTFAVTVVLDYLKQSSGGAWNVAGELRTKFASFSSLVSNPGYMWNMYKTASTDGKFLYITVRGYGHGVGLSQRGAQQMAKDGKSSTFIIDFYFNTAAGKSSIVTVPVTQKALTKISGKGTSAVFGKVTASTLNVRAAASTSGVLVGTLAKGDTVEILSTSGTWYRILYAAKGMVGYVSSDFIQKITTTTTVTGKVLVAALYMRSQPNSSASVVTTLKQGYIVTVLDKNAATNWYKVKYGSYTGYCMYQNGTTKYIELITPSGTPGTITVKAVTAKANVSDSLTIRSSASTTSSKVGSIPAGGTFTVTQVPTTANWLKITYSGSSGTLTGYVMGKYATIGGNSAYRACTVTVPQLNARSGPGGTYGVIGILKSGDTLVVTAKITNTAGTWYKFVTGTTTGYIDSQYARLSTTN